MYLQDVNNCVSEEVLKSIIFLKWADVIKCQMLTNVNATMIIILKLLKVKNSPGITVP